MILAWFLGTYIIKQNRNYYLIVSILFGSPNWARTSDIMINSHALSLLSHSAPDCDIQVIFGQVFS